MIKNPTHELFATSGFSIVYCKSSDQYPHCMLCPTKDGGRRGYRGSPEGTRYGHTLTTTCTSTTSTSKTTTIATMSKPSAQIPVIDISPSNPHAATQLLDAATNYGFVFIENNAAAGVPPANVQDMFDLVSTLVLKNRNRRLMVGIE
jgi:hypothetical protein